MASTAALAIVAGAVAPALLVVLWHILRVSWLPVVLLTEFLVLEALVHNVAVQACCLDLLQSVCCLQTTAAENDSSVGRRRNIRAASGSDLTAVSKCWLCCHVLTDMSRH